MCLRVRWPKPPERPKAAEPTRAERAMLPIIQDVVSRAWRAFREALNPPEFSEHRRAVLRGAVGGIAVTLLSAFIGTNDAQAFSKVIQGHPIYSNKLKVGSTWNPAVRGSGYAGGVAAPTQPASRTTANPWTMAKFWQKTRERYTGATFKLSVRASALTTASVDFFAEGGQPVRCVTQTLDQSINIYSPQIGTNVPLNNAEWAVTVDGAAMQAIITAQLGANAFGIATFYARINPAVAGMQARVIQIDVAYNDHLICDHQYDFGTGQSLATFADALVQAAPFNDNAKHPLFVNHTSGHVEMADVATANLQWDSWGVVTDATPWAATWGRTTPVYPTVPADNAPYWNLNNRWLEFRKTNLDFDNIQGILAYGNGDFYPLAFTGCRLRDSQGYNSTHWQRSIRPTGVCGLGGNYGGIWFIDQTAARDLVQPFAGGVACTNSWFKDVPGSFATPGGNVAPGDSWFSIFVGRTYVNGLPKPDAAYIQPVFSVTCTKGGLSSAEIRITNAGAAGTLALYENGSVPAGNSITIPTYSNQSYWNIEDIVTWINTRTGWSATSLSAVTNVNSQQMYPPSFGSAMKVGTWPYNNGILTSYGPTTAGLDVLNKTGAFGTAYDWHWEIIQFNPPNPPQVIRNVLITDSAFNNIGGGNTTQSPQVPQDVLWENVAIGCNGPEYQGSGGFGASDNGWFSYFSYAVNDVNDAFSGTRGWYASSTTPNGGSGSTFTQAYGYAGVINNTDLTVSTFQSCPIAGSYFQAKNATWPLPGLNVSPNANNTGVSIQGQGTGYTPIFVQPLGSGGTGYDWRAAGALTSVTIATLVPWDMEGNLRSANDNPGPMSKNATAMLAVPSGW